MKMVKYRCPQCSQLDLHDLHKIESEVACKGCQTAFVLPSVNRKELVEVADDWDDDEPQEKTTAMRMALPKGLGRMETKVTQRTADGMAQTFLGGLLALAGMFVAIILGRRGRGA